MHTYFAQLALKSSFMVNASALLMMLEGLDAQLSFDTSMNRMSLEMWN